MRRTLVALVLIGCGSPSKPAVVKPKGDDQPKPPETPASVYPPTEQKPVVDHYFDVDVTDPYQWLEGDGDDVKAWSDAQAKFAQDKLDALPHLDEIRQEVRAILAAPVTTYRGLQSAGGKLFALRKSPDQEQPVLVVMDDPAHPEEATLVLDPTAGAGEHVAIDWFVPSPDGKKVAVSVSSGGSESGTLRLFALGSGVDLEAPIPDVQRGTGGGSAAWSPDGKRIYYTRYPAGDDFDCALYSHVLGTDAAKDPKELGDDFPKTAEIMLSSDATGRVLASVQDGDSGRFEHFLLAKKKWKQLTHWDDHIVSVTLGAKDKLYAVSRDGAPNGKVVLLPKGKTIIPASEHGAIITDFYSNSGLVVADKTLYVRYQQGGPSTLVLFGDGGKRAKLQPSLPPVTAVGEPVAWKGGALVFVNGYTSYGWWQLDAKRASVTALTEMSQMPEIDLSGYEVRREEAISKDGTHVPVNIVWPTGAPQDGTHPCVVTGYGGYGISMEPAFLGTASVLLAHGACFAVANLRGGGEFGEAWHQAGTLTQKQNVFDDFAAVLQYMIDQKYTSPAHLAIEGGSNGGLLMGAMITQHPDLVAAVSSDVGIYDMLRSELSANGQFNIPEYGTVKDEAQFRALYAYSPYHHVVAGTHFPAILFTTGANDPRVAPWHSRKMVAALQAAEAGDAPILLRTTSTAGHGMGSSTSERVDLISYRWAFLLATLAMR